MLVFAFPNETTNCISYLGTRHASAGRGSSLTLGKNVLSRVHDMNRFCVALLLGTIACTARAHLGDSETALCATFGKPVARGSHLLGKQRLGPTLYFSTKELGVSCELINDRCVRIRYVCRVSWTEERIQSLLAENANGKRWSETTEGNPKVVRSWRRSDDATAEWRGSLTGLTISAPQ